jgi:hypothetical protein
MTVSLGIELLMKVRCVFQSQHSRHVTEPRTAVILE